MQTGIPSYALSFEKIFYFPLAFSDKRLFVLSIFVRCSVCLVADGNTDEIVIFDTLLMINGLIESIVSI